MTLRGAEVASASASWTSIMGPSGSGRRILLHVLASVLRPTAGSLDIDGPARLGLDAVDAELIGRLVEQARAGGLQLTGEGGLLQQLTKRVLESALEGKITDHPETVEKRQRRPSGVEEMTERQRPLDRVYPMIYLDAIYVKIRDGNVANRPIYVALAVTADGTRDILGLWLGDGGEGAIRS